MKTKLTKAQKRLQKVKEFLGTLNCEHIDLPYFTDEDTNSFDDLRDAIESGNGFNVEVIYYSRAIEYLKENDASLKESLGLAAEMGFTPENLSSEILASLLATQNARQQFEELESEITNFFESLD